MAKGAITKKRKAPSIHSRVARRATSPSIDTDKSLKNIQPPAESVDYRPSVLAIHQGAGVSKKAKKGRNMSSKARRRHEKEQDRAANIMERTEKKIAKSKGQARAIQSRSKAWDEINNQIPTNKSEPQREVDNREDEVSEFDEEMDDAQSGEVQNGATSADKVPLQEVEDEDEIL
ncbi:Alb1-domain-containing protein [Daldinia caldariorum]|uniref:Alb1-domain-containing protein n=1 Tax=Daldinia caldariorum TaxID=326644 RepID=UPI002008AEBF|nr:Alb1-domain-containing protein [Daldinia caldariorum]KAI1464616.1 Alb1-domain-containing protein [Daldinia caldariorum]